MADAKLSALTPAGALADADLMYVVQSGASYQTTVGAIKTAMAGIQGTVANHAALPVTIGTPIVGSMYYVEAATGTWILGTKKERGFWRRTANAGALSDWTHQSDTVELTLDSTGVLMDDGDNTKKLQFQLSGITTATTRTLTVPDASGTIMLVGNAPTAHAASHTNGTDDIQSATAGQKGLMTAAAMTKLDGIEALADVTDAANVAAAGALMTTTKADVLEAAYFAADAGASDTYAATLSPAITAYVTGARYRFKANTANTGAATINFNALGAKSIVKAAGGITTALADNDIRAGQWVDLVYDGTNMQMQSTLGNAAGGGWSTGRLFSSGASAEVINNTTTETSVFSGTVPGNTLGTTGAVHLIVSGQLTNVTGSNQTLTVTVKFGATNMWADVTPNIGTTGTARTWRCELHLFADAATNAQRLEGAFTIGPAAAATTGYGDLNGSPVIFNFAPFGGTAAEDSTGDLTLDVRMTLSAASTSYTVTRHKGWCNKL